MHPSCSDFMQVFFTSINIYMKQESPEMDDFEEKKLVAKEKYFNSFKNIPGKSF